MLASVVRWREGMLVGTRKRVRVFWRPSTSDACSRCAMEGGHGVTHGALNSTAIKAFVSMEGATIIIIKTCLLDKPYEVLQFC